MIIKKQQESVSIQDKINSFSNRESDIIDGVDLTGGNQNSNCVSERNNDDGAKIEFDADVFDSALCDLLDLVIPGGGNGKFEKGLLGGDDEGKAGVMDKYMNTT